MVLNSNSKEIVMEIYSDKKTRNTMMNNKSISKMTLISNNNTYVGTNIKEPSRSIKDTPLVKASTSVRTKSVNEMINKSAKSKTEKTERDHSADII